MGHALSFLIQFGKRRLFSTLAPVNLQYGKELSAAAC
jgi:hypothetical protein